MEDYDVIIVGAGPSGSISAYTLARRGFRVILIDKERFPRFKPCGGVLTEKVANLLRNEGLFHEGIIERSHKVVDIYFREFHIVTIDLDTPILVVDRSNFDYFLLRKAIDAGAVFREKEYALGVSCNYEKAYLITNKMKYRSEIIIGADGVNSKVALTSGVRTRWSVSELGIASQAFGYTSDPHKIDYTRVSLYFGYLPYGYGWVFPMSNKVNVGIGTYMKYSPYLINAQTKYLRYISKGMGVDVAKVHYHPLSFGNDLNRKVARERILLVGDAAGLVDPWIGEGIYYALLSGLLASKVIIRYFSNERSGFISHSYELLIRETLKNLSYAFKISKVFYDHINLSLRLLRRANIFSQYLSMLLSGRLSYIQLYRKLINPLSLLIDSLTI